MTVAIIFFVGFVLAVVAGQALKINPGIVAIALGFILFWIFGGKDGAIGASSGFIQLFPAKLFWNYAIPVIFYAFAAANGTLNVLGRKIVYVFRNARWALPFAIFLVAVIVAVAGAGTMNTFIHCCTSGLGTVRGGRRYALHCCRGSLVWLVCRRLYAVDFEWRIDDRHVRTVPSRS